jgi:hypothetical protein
MSKKRIIYYEKNKPLEDGKKRFTITYRGFFEPFVKTDIDEIDEDCARAYFKKFYPSAVLLDCQLKK